MSFGRISLCYDELNTLLVEIESVVNSRPLTHVEDDQDGVSYTLSPSHLINGRRITNTPNDRHFAVISTNEWLTRRARHHRHLLRQFTNQWRKICLLNLRERHVEVTKNRKGADIALGDVVIHKTFNIIIQCALSMKLVVNTSHRINMFTIIKSLVCENFLFDND